MTRGEAIQFIDGIIVDIKSQTFAANMVRANGKPILTTRLTYRNFRRLQALEMAKNALMGSEKSPEGCPENCTDDVFDKMKYRCEYGHLSYDENRVGSWTCHHVNNKPKGCSWGTCDKSVCPILKGE